MTLHPDKVAAAILFKMYAYEDDGNDDLNSVFSGVASAAAVRAQLGRLENLGLIIRFGSTEADVWSLTHEGHELAFRLASKPKSFVARLQEKGLVWLRDPEAGQAQMAPIFQRFEVDRILSETRVEPATSESINWTKWGTILAAAGIVITIAIALVS